MRLLIIGLSLLFSVSLFANSEIIIDIGDVEYTCKPTAENNDPSSRIKCINLAYNDAFTKSEAIQLCKLGGGVFPASCAIRSYKGPFSKSETLKLCTAVENEDSIDCAELSYDGPFSKSETLDLCTSPGANKKTALCAIEAYNGPFSKSESIDLCKNKSFINTSIISKDLISKLVKDANIKAVSRGEYK